MSMAAEKCPVKVGGTTVEAADSANGASLTFTTASGDVGALRQKVRGMAEMHNQHKAMDGTMMRGNDAAMYAGASVVDVDGGARLVLEARQPADLGAVREHARMGEKRMGGGDCSMMAAPEEPKPPTSPAGEADHDAHQPSERRE